jgi:predicted CXXCH cytochrome family protein
MAEKLARREELLDGLRALYVAAAFAIPVAVISMSYDFVLMDVLGTDLRNDHPVGFSYTSSLAAGKVLARTPPAELRLYGTDRRLECATCHDVHAAGRLHLLRISTDNSALCIGCHL